MTDIVPRQPGDLAARQPEGMGLGDKMRYAEALAHAGMLPKQYQKQPANILFALEYAQALGLPAINAITGIHVVEGKPSASAELIAAMVRKAGHRLRVTGDDRTATAHLIRADDPDFTYEATWTLERARVAGLAGKNVWKNYPAAMLRARAITEVARMGASDALYGLVYTPEELGAEVDRTGLPTHPAPLAPERVTAAEIRARHTIQPKLPLPPEEPISRQQQTALHAGLGSLGYTDRDDKLALLTEELGRDITSSSDLTYAEAREILDRIRAHEIRPYTVNQGGPVEPVDGQITLDADGFPEPPADWTPDQ